MIGRRTRLLARVFFDRLFEHEVFSSSAPASRGVVWLVAAAATPGVMVSASQYYTYAHARAFSPEALDRLLFLGQAFHVAFAMALAAAIAMLVWTSLTPDRRDALVLGPLPVTDGEQARGRLIAVGGLFALFVVAAAVPAGVTFTLVTMGGPETAGVMTRVAAHVSTVTLGAAFVFFGLVSLQLALAAVAGPRGVAAASWVLQAAAIVAVVSAVSFTSRLGDALLAGDAAGRLAVAGNPVAWFTGLYRWLSGDTTDLFAMLAARGVAASAVAVAVALVVWPVAQRRARGLALAGDGPQPGAWIGAGGWWMRAFDPWLRRPLERALARFILATLGRSASHRLVVGGYAGIGIVCAIPWVDTLAGPAATAAASYAWFSVPLGLLCWTMAGVRVAMMLPIQPGANWVFRLTEPVEKCRILSAAVTVLVGTTAVPLAVVFGAAAVRSGGVVPGAQVLAVVFTAGLALAELLTLTLRAVPCTCTYRPGQLRLRVWWPVYLVVWLTIAYVFPWHATAGPDGAAGTVWLVAGLLAAWSMLRLWRSARARRLAALVYEEPDPSGATTIDLSGVRG
jgi:hypothetical protein